MKKFTEILNEKKNGIESNIEIFKKMNDIVKYIKAGGELSTDAKKGKKVVDKISVGVYDLIYMFDNASEIRKYADESLQLSPEDVGKKEADDEFWEMLDNWDDVKNNAQYIAEYNKQVIPTHIQMQMQNIMKDTMKKINKLYPRKKRK